MNKPPLFYLCVGGVALSKITCNDLEQALKLLKKAHNTWPGKKWSIRAPSSSFLFEWTIVNSRLVSQIVVPDNLKTSIEGRLHYE